MDRSERNIVSESVQINGLDDPKIETYIPKNLLDRLREEVEIARALLPPFDKKAFLEGTLSPIWFGSAINSFGFAASP